MHEFLRGMDQARAPGAPAFSFWSSMADLGRLVLRSKAKGLKTRLMLALALVLAGKWTGVVAPLLLQGAIDRLDHRAGHGSAVLLAFAGFIAGWVGLRFIATAAPYVRDSIFTPVSQKALAQSAVESFAHSLRLSLDFHQGKQSGGLSRIIERGANSTDFLIRSVVFNLGPTLIELIMAAAVLGARFTWRLAAVAVATITVYAALTFALSNWRMGHRRAMNAADSETAAMAIDALMNFETIKAFGSEDRMVQRLAGAYQTYTSAAVKANTSLQLLNAVQSVVLSLGLLATALIAGAEVLAGRMTLGGVTACVLILQTVYAPLFTLGTNYRLIRQSFVDMEQMLALLAVAPDIDEIAQARDLPIASPAGARLAFEQVSFRHTARSAGLHDITFAAEPGSTTALVGPSGAGKTTIVRLALRLVDPQGGRVTIDGVDLRQARLASLRRTAALVPQDVALFNDSIGANIAFADPAASEDQVWAAAEAAELAGFIRNLPQKMATLVGERGLKLSGGERQRVGLARALLADPRLLILDEATSALDSRTEAAIQATLRNVRAGRTTLVIAHRLSTIADADQILVLRKGRIVERGDHRSLLAVSGEYAALWRRQTRGAQERRALAAEA
ncbi:MAG TPA: ABC transporter ATP-binding protein/permease [Caulobacteraceae bacterium]|nr:ABC transporter ATP-binding protein/permease [Caulobacteraceae bacterium]